MIISTSSHNILLSSELDRFVDATMRQALERLSEDILSIDVFLKDVNGPKGGVDKQVIVRLHLGNRRQLAIETEGENLRAAVRLSAKRAKRAVRRSLGKSRRFDKLRLHKHLETRSLSSGVRA
jgi:hypothetical protein